MVACCGEVGFEGEAARADFWRPCAPPKSCRNQKSFWDLSTYHPNTTGMGWVYFFSKKHVLVGHPNEATFSKHLCATHEPRGVIKNSVGTFSP